MICSVRHPLKKTLFTLILVVLILTVTLVAAEVVSRLLTTTDENGNVYLKNRRLLPYRFPLNTTKHRIEVFKSRRDEAYVIDHPLLGWTVGENRNSENGLYHSNSRGIRSAPREYSDSPAPDTLRIALFGDSFTHGDEEPWYNTWAAELERNMNRAGIRAEVLNFGVGGYGFSQAYLRWFHQGREFQPRIVVIGFQGENMERTVNIFRSLYSSRTWLVFSKPRHIIDAAGDLRVVNSPVVPPDEVAGYLENFPDRHLSKYEFWYNPKNYRAPFWTKSRFGQIIYNLSRTAVRDHKTYKIIRENGGTPEEITAALIESWASRAARDGAVPLVVHLPRRDHLRLLARGEDPAYYKLFDGFRAAEIEVIDPAPVLVLDREGLYGRSHFSAKGSKIVARVLADRITELLTETGEVVRYHRPPPLEGPAAILDMVEEDGGVEIAIGLPEDRFFLVDGFHDPELYERRIPARWTSETARIRIPLAAPPGRELMLEIHLVGWGPKGNSLKAEIDGMPLESVPGNKDSFQFILPPSGEEAKIVILGIIAPVWSPLELGLSDDRRLGVMIDRIRVIPNHQPKLQGRSDR